MELDLLKSWFGGLALLISVLGAIYGWLTSRSNINAEKLKSVDEKLHSHDQRLQHVENELKHMPDKDVVMELKLAMSKLEGTVGRMDEGMKGVSRTVKRIDDYLMNRKEN